MATTLVARVGDRIVVRGPHVGDPDRSGRIDEVRHDDGSPPYVVSWDDGHQGLFFPGDDAFIQRTADTPAADRETPRPGGG